jgi:hypothetical protein
MMTIEIKRDTDRQDNYKCYTIKGFLNDTSTRFHTRHGKESWQRYAVLIVGFEALEIDRKRFALMLKRIRADNRENYRRTA